MGLQIKAKHQSGYIETITNPLMDVPELRKIIEFAKSHNLISMIDNTFASPVLYCPAIQGFDISLHSCHDPEQY